MTRQQPRAAVVRLDQVDFHPHNVRRDLGDLRDLVESIHRHGIIQPFIVEVQGQRLRLRAGHRRLAAARLAGLKTAPALVWPEALDEAAWIEQALHENVMRRGVDKLERRDALLRLRELGWSTADLAASFGTTTQAVGRWMSLENLGEVRDVADTDGRKHARDHVAAWATKKAAGTTTRISSNALGTFAAAWRAHPGATLEQLLDALDSVAATGRTTDHLPPAEEDAA